MTTLSDFRAGLLDPERPVPAGLLDGAQVPTIKRYGVYRNNVTVSLIEAMQAAFPLVGKLIGTDNFDRLAGLFIRAHPPKSPLIMFYGIDFPAFLQSFEPLKHIGYLPDAARLDLALRQSYHAADSAPFDPTPFQTLSADALLDATFTIAPACRIVASDWPLFDIWAFNQEPAGPQPRSIPQDVIITRPAFDPLPHALPLGAAHWLEQLEQGTSFGAAHDQTLLRHPDFNLTESLTCAFSAQAFAEIHHKDLT